MERERWEKLKLILGDALELDPAERESFVREAANDDPDLLSELLSLLKESGADSELLFHPALTRTRALRNEEAPRFLANTVLARRFLVVRFIARGGMGEIYEAEDLELGGRVALKAIRRSMAPHGEALALFKKEIHLARRVTHASVCRIFDLAQHDEADGGMATMLLSMELIEGRALSEHLRERGPLDLRDALPLIDEIAAGLQAVHDAGVIHGDLKPANVMLASRPGRAGLHAVLMDFGMALPATSDSHGARVHRGGTPDYLAPEQAQGGAATTASDVYCFALVITEMVGLPRPEQTQRGAPRVPAGWASVLRRGLDPHPARRPSRPVELAKALRSSAGQRSPIAKVFALAALLAALGFIATLFMKTRTETVRSTTSRQLLTEGDVTVWCASPDGRFVAATSWDTGDLILRDINDGTVRSLTHKTALLDKVPSLAYAAKFSPRGDRVVYQWRNSRTEAEIRLVGVDGKGERTLYRNSNANPAPVDWSPDGSQILIRLLLWSDNTPYLIVVSAKDGSVRFPKMLAGRRVGRVLFGADANTLVFDAEKGPHADVEIHRLPFGGVESTLVGGPGANSVIGWSPDRRRLIFSNDRRGQPGIWAVSVSNRGAEGEPRELVPDARNWEPLGIADAGSLFYRHDADSTDVYTAVLDLAYARTMSAPEPVMDRFIGSYHTPNWSDDGRRLVFASNHDTRHPTLCIYEPKSGARRELRLELASMARPQWWAHGKAVMVVGTGIDGQEGLFRINPVNGEAKLFMTAQDLESSFEGVWSRDGTTQFNRYRDWRRGLFRMDAGTRAHRVLYLPPPGVDLGTENLALSPDGHLLAFQARNDGARISTLMLIPAEGGEARPLLTIHRPEVFLFGSFTWTPDSRQILAARTRDKITEIWQVPVDGSSPAKIDFPAMRLACLRLSPDGKTIAFVKVQSRSEIWLLQNFLSRDGT